MIADSGGGHRNGTDDTHRDASHDLRRATSLLRLLKSGEGEALDDPELQQEFRRLHELLDRIDRLADDVAVEDGESEHQAEPASASTAERPTEAASGARQAPAGGDYEASDQPGSRATAEGEQVSPQPSSEPAVEPGATPSQSRESEIDDRCQRWWVHFNGDLSLERLSKLRAHLNDSPFTIDTRYDEITDGLIVMRVVTEEHISMDQLNWVLRQLMDQVELDRNSAIVSKQ